MSAFKSGHGTGTMSRNETFRGRHRTSFHQLDLFILKRQPTTFQRRRRSRVCLLMLFVLFYPRSPIQVPNICHRRRRGEIEPSPLTNRRHGSAPWPDLR